MSLDDIRLALLEVHSLSENNSTFYVTPFIRQLCLDAAAELLSLKLERDGLRAEMNIITQKSQPDKFALAIDVLRLGDRVTALETMFDAIYNVLNKN